MKNSWLYGKTVVLSGASSGIGREMTKILIKTHNCKVLGIGRNEEKMKSLKQELVDKSENFSYYLFDVAVNKNWLDFAKEITEKDIKIDVLINNAGQLPPFNKFDNYSIEDCENIMKINYFSNIYSIKALIDIIRKSETPAIINISSSASLCAMPGISIYTASKGALKNFTESLIAEEKGKIYVSLICPGFTKTDIFRNQTVKTSSKLVNLISMQVEKMGKKIVKCIEKKKTRKVFGVDAKLMSFLYQIIPSKASTIYGGVLRASKVSLFDNVFDKKNNSK